MSLFHKKSTPHDADAVSFWILLACIVVLPIFVYVSASMPPMITKVGVAGILVCIALIAFSISAIRTQALVIPKSWLLASAWLLPLAYVLSLLFSGNTHLSVFGERLTMDTVAFMFVGVAGLTLTAMLLTSQKRALLTYFAFIVAAVFVAVSQLLLFFGRGIIEGTGAIFTSLSVLGTLNDLATFFGLIIVFALLSLLLLPVTSIVRGILVVVLVGALYFLSVVNLTVLWWILGMFSLAVFVYSALSQGVRMQSRWISFAPLFTLMVCAMFLYGPATFTSKPAEWAQVGELDVRPSWQTTIGIGRAVFGEHALFGIGPLGFERAWSLHMPESINRTEFWQANFSYGIGFIPTSIIATGLLGAIAWVLFLGWFLVQGVRSLVLARAGTGPDIQQYIRSTSFISALYLWAVAFIQVPSPAILMYAFILTGVFIASLSFEKSATQPVRIVFTDNPRVGFLATLLLTVVALAGVGGVYGFSSRVYAESLFQHAVREVQLAGDLDESERYARKAIAIQQVDAYYRLLSTLDTTRLRLLLAENRPPEEIAEPVRDFLIRAIGNATRATVIDPHDYQNWVHQGALYQNIIPLGYAEAAESANIAFDKAMALRPHSAYLHYTKGLLARGAGNADEARSYVERAISLRNAYTDAIFLLAQIQLEANEIESAVRSVEAITLFEPQNPVAHFQLGLLRYGGESFEEAARALEQAVTLAPEYANAHYFLGLTYSRLGNTDQARASFERVLETNPAHEEVQAIIANLREGKAPFASASASEEIQNMDALPFDPHTDGVSEVGVGVVSGTADTPLRP